MDHPAIKKGYDVPVAGAPAPDVEEVPAPSTYSVYPGEIRDIKLRLSVQEGDHVKRGSQLFHDKRDERVCYRSPVAGTVRSIVRGARRFVQEIVIAPNPEDSAENFTSYTAEALLTTDREELLTHLAGTAYLSLIEQRPFSRPASPSQLPKSIFVNAASTAPFTTDPAIALAGVENAFQAGLNALTRLTDGSVHLCHASGRDAGAAVEQAQNVEKHGFCGKHPAGNPSVHIAAVDPIKPGEYVWAVDATNVALIGQLLLDGELPTSRVIALAGPGLTPGSAKHYRVRIGGSLAALLENRVAEGETRLVSGDLLSGVTIQPDSALPFLTSGLNVISEGRERSFLGWMKPAGRLSFSRAYASGWAASDGWALDTNKNGGDRAMVLTGYYDRVMPLNIMVDYLVRAVLANDTDEAIRLGILETDPSDFALCEFICPCKMEIQKIIRRGLDMIEEEGI